MASITRAILHCKYCNEKDDSDCKQATVHQGDLVMCAIHDHELTVRITDDYEEFDLIIMPERTSLTEW